MARMSKVNLIFILLIGAILIIIAWFIIFSGSSFKNDIIVEPAEKIILGYCQVATEGVWRSVNTESIKQAAENENIRLIFLKLSCASPEFAID